MNFNNDLQFNNGQINNITFDFNKFERINIDVNNINPTDILEEVEATKKCFEAIPHGLVLEELLKKVERVDFKAKVFPNYPKLLQEYNEAKTEATNADGSTDKEKFEKVKELKKKLDKMRVTKRHFIVESIEELIRLSKEYNWGLCRKNGFVYLYNSAYWSLLEEERIKDFIRDASQKMGVDKYTARYCDDKDKLFKQFLAEASLSEPEQVEKKVLINLENGTFEITPNGSKIRSFNRNDFLTYQLPFEYEPRAKAPLFQSYLNTVQPDRERQNLLAEYLAYVFTRHLKLEKTLLLYGTGANGKSVFFEIVNALLGSQNVSSYSLQSLTDDKGYHRAKLANTLVNYASEINGKLETSIFKQLVSGEDVEARLPYGQPFILKSYAKMIFNCNELPKEVEHTNAYFRRFLIVPFEVTIPEEKQDKELSDKIIDTELSGVFNWVLEGLSRLLEQKRFSKCEAVENQLKDYRLKSDSVHLFLEEENLIKSANNWKQMKDLYSDYKHFCMSDNYRPVSKSNFKKRLNSKGVLIEKKNVGYVAYLEKNSVTIP